MQILRDLSVNRVREWANETKIHKLLTPLCQIKRISFVLRITMNWQTKKKSTIQKASAPRLGCIGDPNDLAWLTKQLLATLRFSSENFRTSSPAAFRSSFDIDHENHDNSAVNDQNVKWLSAFRSVQLECCTMLIGSCARTWPSPEVMQFVSFIHCDGLTALWSRRATWRVLCLNNARGKFCSRRPRFPHVTSAASRGPVYTNLFRLPD
jgi:hypothetical protein